MRLCGTVVFLVLSQAWAVQAFGMCKIVFQVHPLEPNTQNRSIESRKDKDHVIVIDIDRSGIFDLDSKAIALLANDNDLLELGDRIVADFYERRIFDAQDIEGLGRSPRIAFHINPGSEVKTESETKVSQVAFSHSLEYRPSKKDFFNSNEMTLEDIAFLVRYSWIREFFPITRPDSESLQTVFLAASSLFSERSFNRWRKGEAGAMRKLGRVAPLFVKKLLSLDAVTVQKLTDPSFLNRDRLVLMALRCENSDRQSPLSAIANPFGQEKTRRDLLQSTESSWKFTTDVKLEGWLERTIKEL